MTRRVEIVRADYSDPDQRLVIPYFRDQGVGKALLKKIETIAIDTGCCKMTLEVQENNAAARRLYHRFGFKDSFLDPEAGSQLFMTKLC